MPLFKTSNPALSSNTFRGMSDSSYGDGISSAQYGGAISTSTSMTLRGTVNKTGILLVLAVASAFFTWTQFAATHDPASVAECQPSGHVSAGRQHDVGCHHEAGRD